MSFLIKNLLRYRILVWFLILVLLVAGLFSFYNLPIDAFPDVSNQQVMILTEAEGMSAPDVEMQISRPLENAMSGLPYTTLVRSVSKPYLSQVVVVFADGVDTYLARQLVTEKLVSAIKELPEGISPQLGPIAGGLGEVFQYSLQSDRHSLTELRTIQDWQIAPRLRSVSGVNEVNSFGGFVRQIIVAVDPEKLQKYELSLPEVKDVVKRSNANAGGGFITNGWEQENIRTAGLLHSPSELADTVLKLENNQPVYLSDVAEINEGYMTRYGAVTRDGKGEVVSGMIIMLKDESASSVVQRVRQALANIIPSLPDGVSVDVFYDRLELLSAVTDTMRGTLWQGGALVILVLFFFMGNLRAALLVSCTLPLTLFFAFILMGLSGMSANLMTLGGLAIALGMVVDSSIVVAENVLRHVQERADNSLLKAVTTGVVEVASPIIFCTLIVAFVLMPVLTLEGMEGRFFKPLALSMNFAMAGSVLMAILFLPVLLFTVGKKINGSEKPEIFFDFLLGLYQFVLTKVLRYRRSSIFCCLLIMAAVLPLAFIPGVDFLPELDEGAIAINVVRLPNASLVGSVETASFMEQELLKFSEIKTVVSKTGRAEIAEDPMGPEQTDLLIMLHPQKEWKTARSKSQLVDDMRHELQKLPGMQFTFTQPVALRINELVSGIKSDLAIKVFGPDLPVLQELANEAAAIIHDLKGAHDVNTEPLVGISEIEVRPKRKELARYGLNVADLNELVELALRGSEAGEFREQEMRFPIQLRLQEDFRNSVKKISNLSFLSPSGSMVLLHEVADLVKIESPAVINRENAMRRVAVECNIQGVDTGGFVLAAKAALSDFIAKMPAGYWLEFGGTYQNQQRAMTRLSVITPICILLIVVLLCTAFQELRPALIILAALPFALVGGVIALVYTGLPYNVPSIIGFIALFGLSIQDGTVLLSFAQQLKSEGLSHYEAIKKAAELRFRSLLMTTVTTVFGLFPLIKASGPGASILQPLALVMTGGMISATTLTLIILPVLYAGLFDHTVQKTDNIPA